VKSAPKPAAKPAPAKPVPAKTVAVAAAQPASKPAPAAAPAASKAPQSKNPVPVSKSPAKTAVKSDSAPKTVSRPVGKVAVAVAARSAAPAPRSKYKVVEYKTDEATGRPILPAGYKPSSEEEYMSPLQQEYFRQRLQNWRADLVEESKQTIENLREEVRDIGDEAERATRETENSLELRTRDRYRKLIGKIDSTLKRLEAGDYGYCVDTGEEIGLERLEARLTAERTIDAQERWEHLQKQQGD
jgi:DnaK suppressor protein